MSAALTIFLLTMVDDAEHRIQVSWALWFMI